MYNSTIGNSYFHHVASMTSNQKQIPRSRQARCRTKEMKQLNQVQERGREANMLMQHARGKRRPRSDHEHASSELLNLVHVLKLCPFDLCPSCDVLNLV
jgi:hypothetical protein